MSTSDRLWALLYGGWGPPRRASIMTGRRGTACKYLDLEENYTFTPEMLAAHLAGRETYAATLGAAGVAWCGCKDYDDASEAEILAALDAARANNLIAVAILMPGNRAHIWAFYDRAYPIADIRAQLRTIPRKGSGEIYPSGNPVRLPFGYHKVKKTRGTLVLQDGRRFPLDDLASLSAGLSALLTLPRNGKPEPAPASDAHSSGQAWGDAYKPEEWNDLPDGGPLWRSPYVARAATTRPDLAKLLRGERVTLSRDNTPDDTDSAQVAALAYNLGSADIDRQQARAIADYLKPQLRPHKSIEHYRAHFDAEWERYLPSYYTGRVIRILGPADGDAPTQLAPAEHKPERKSRARKDRPQKVAGAAGYLEWLRTHVDPQSDTVMLSQRQCAERLGCNVRTIKRYEEKLKGKIERRTYARRQAGCLFILTPDDVPTSLADVVITDAVVAQPVAENAVPVSMQEEHTPPVDPTPLTLAELVAEAFDLLAADKMRLSFSRVKRYVRANAPRPYNDAAIHRRYEQERKERAWQREIAKLPTMPVGKLNALDKRAQRVLSEGEGAKTYKWAAAIYPHISAEQERRAEMRERLRTGPRRSRTVEQALIFAEVEDQIADHRASTKRRKGPIAHAVRLDEGAPSARGVLPLPAAAPIDPSGIIGRLKQQRDERIGASGYD